MDNDSLIVNNNLILELIRRYTKKTGVIGLAFHDEDSKYSNSLGYLGYYYIKLNKKIDLNNIKKYDSCEIGFPEGKALFISRARWMEVGGYDNHLMFGGDDSDLGIKLWLKGYKNYFYSKTIQVHLGSPERQNNKKYFLKWKEMLYAHLYTVVKNYTFLNMLITLFGLSIFGLLKSIKQSVQRESMGPLFSFLGGYYLFLKNLPIAIKKRKIIQKQRVMKDDIFLKVRIPEVS
jgi:GT2 family glycosyltransferase